MTKYFGPARSTTDTNLHRVQGRVIQDLFAPGQSKPPARQSQGNHIGIFRDADLQSRCGTFHRHVDGQPTVFGLGQRNPGRCPATADEESDGLSTSPQIEPRRAPKPCPSCPLHCHHPACFCPRAGHGASHRSSPPRRFLGVVFQGPLRDAWWDLAGVVQTLLQTLFRTLLLALLTEPLGTRLISGAPLTLFWRTQAPSRLGTRALRCQGDCRDLDRDALPTGHEARFALTTGFRLRQRPPPQWRQTAPHLLPSGHARRRQVGRQEPPRPTTIRIPPPNSKGCAPWS